MLTFGLGLIFFGVLLLPFDFTLAIVNWNTKALLRNCLDSIRAHGDGFRIQVLVADNDSSDGSADMVEEAYPEVTLVRNPGNLGFAAGHEPLFRLSRGRYHVLINSDLELRQGALQKVYQRMEQEPGIGILGCAILDEHGLVQPSCRRFPSLGQLWIDASGLNRLFSHSKFWNGYKMGDFDHLHSRDVDQVMGSFFAIRAELLERVGVLDTGFFMYYEEVDYCRRAVQAGYRVFYEANARVYHLGGGSANKVRELTIRRTARSMRRYFSKHMGPLARLCLPVIMSLSLVTHTLHALVKRREIGLTLRAYALGLWDILRNVPANT